MTEPSELPAATGPSSNHAVYGFVVVAAEPEPTATTTTAVMLATTTSGQT